MSTKMWGLPIFVFLTLIVPDVLGDIELVGAAISFYPTDNNTVAFDYRLSWINEMNVCLSDTPSSLPCPTGGNDIYLFREINCTDTETHRLNWTSGRGRLIHQPEEIQMSYALSHGTIEANLEVRDGRINSSPTADMVPIVLFQDGCTHTLRIPVGDVDGDVIKCRWSTVTAPYDCGDICDGPLEAEAEAHLDEEKCEITYTPSNSTGNYLAILQIEDFSNTDSNTSLSSVPLQFFVRVYNDTDNHVDRKGNNCKHVLYFIDSTPADRACLEVEVDFELVITITAKYTSKLDIVTIKPVGVLSTDENYTSVSETDEIVTRVNITWKPLMSDGDRFHIVCFYANEPLRLRTSETRCIRIAVKGPNWSSNRLNRLFCAECQLPNAEVWNISYTDPNQTAYVFGEAVTYRCNAGYRSELAYQETSSSTCMENGSFEDFQHCVRIECQLPNGEDLNISYTDPIQNAYVFGEAVTHRCNAGYRSELAYQETSSSTCMEIGSFGEFQHCVRIECQLPNAEVWNISYTDPIQNAYVFGEAVTHRCNVGYRSELAYQEKSSSTCMENGSFGEFQHCVCIECQLPNGDDLNISYTDPIQNAYVFGEAVTYRCNAGYRSELAYQETSSSTCMENGSFGEFQHCVRIECQLPNAEDLNISYTDQIQNAYVFGEAVTHRCNVGYRSELAYQETSSSICMENGSFGEFQHCVRIECQLPNGEDLNISYTDPIQNVYVFGEAVTYRCNAGYRSELAYQETSSSICMENGSFGEFQNCVRIECQLPNGEDLNISYTDPIQNAYVFGEAVSYRCNAGYRSELAYQDTSSSTCMESGSFGQFQHCVRIECQLPNGEDLNISYTDPIQNAYVFGEAVSYRCNAGYRSELAYQDTSSSTCMESGSFGQFQHCVRIECQLPNGEDLNISYTDPIQNAYVFGEAVSYRCNAGYRSELAYQETSSSTCMENGSFGEFQHCVRIECQLPNGEDLNISYTDPIQNAYVFGEAVTYRCNAGYGSELAYQETSSSTCMENGSFGQFQHCVRIECQLPNAEVWNISYTDPIQNEYVFGEAVTFRCNAGYGFELAYQDTSSSTCMEDGSFGEFQHCVRIECKLPDTSNLNWIGVQPQKEFYYAETVAYACNNGYRFHDREKIKTIKCTDSGKFEKHTKCELTPKCQKDTDNRGTTWNETLAENRANSTCPNDDQEITRLCDADGKWKAPLYKCVRKEIQNLGADINGTLKHKNGTLKQANATEINAVVERLTIHTVIKGDTEHENETLTSGELVALTSSLETIANVLNNSNNNEAVKNENITKNFLLSCDNLIDSSNQNSWNAQTAEKKPGAETVLHAVDVLVEAIGKNLENDSTTIIQKNMALEIKRVDMEVKEMVFPNEQSMEEANENNWIKESRSSISLSSEALTDSNETYVTTAVMYKDLSEILPTSVVNDTSEKNGKSEPESSVEKKINGPILAMSIIPHVDILDPPVKITFQHFDKRLTKPDCSFWDFNRNEWSTQGCKVASRSKSNTVCECSHLTNFAVLMSPFKEVDTSSVALEVISILGVAVSIVCLLLTLIIHVLFWKLLSNERTVILMNLCVALVISNITFLAGINATANPIVCAGVAAFLQYIYLVVFCIMLVEGITIAITILYVFKTKKSSKLLLIPAWVVPVFIVGISLLSTEAEGYGTESFCWLSIENGLIWTFVGPVLIILLCNVICLTLVFRAMFKTTAMETKKAVEKVKTSFRCLCVLLPLMGLSWILGIFYVDERTVFIQYIFTILNAFQGFFIFLFHCLMSKQVKKDLQLRFRRFSATHTAFKSFSSTSGKQGSIKTRGQSKKDAGKSIDEAMSSMSPTESKSAPSESTQTNV